MAKGEVKALEETALGMSDEEDEPEPIPPHELWAMLVKACKKGEADSIRHVLNSTQNAIV